MSEYIEREVAFDMITDLAGMATTKAAYAAIWKSAKELNKIPAAYIAEIVRCKDCKNYNKDYHRCNLHSEEPDQYSTGFIFEMQEEDYCSYGERKANNE